MKKIIITGGLLVLSLILLAALILVVWFVIDEHNYKKENKSYALDCAIQKENIKEIKKLLPQVDEIVNVQLNKAIATNNPIVVKLLLDRRKVQTKSSAFSPDIIPQAIRQNNIEIVKLLLSSDKNIELFPLLKTGATYGSREMMEFLLTEVYNAGYAIINNEAGKEGTAEIPSNWSVQLLNSAIDDGNKKVIDLLVERGVRTDSLPAAIALGKKEEVEKCVCFVR